MLDRQAYRATAPRRQRPVDLLPLTLLPALAELATQEGMPLGTFITVLVNEALSARLAQQREP